MHNGHRGINHPVQNLATGKCEVTSQNHGFGIKAEDVENHPTVEATHINLNDKTVEGIKVNDKNAFSVQYILNHHLALMIQDIYLTLY